MLPIAVRAAPAPQTFDLICTGSGLTERTQTRTPFSVHYSVDLQRGVWVTTGERNIRKIFAISDSLLTLTSEEIQVGDQKTMLINIGINRLTGEYFGLMRIAPYNNPMTGQCVKASYTPIPNALF